MIYKKHLTKEQAFQKIKHYCAYQERCQSEVKDKLYKLGVWKKDHDEIIATLIEENYLSEERFAELYARGKFRLNQWGFVKIRFALRQKQVSEQNIKIAIGKIDQKEYAKTLAELAAKKYSSLKSEQDFTRKKKTIDYLMQKGFEPQLVNEVVKGVTKSHIDN